ncbi:hypothetical protein [Roseibacillus persicicus]|uniref:hypothetical protein n=1 Tax=Roseibacillus persicicus TaxID=454148 RepID=UPI00280C468D|nr:hypothetical protein [Roseibacillus persicicus]MDQ8191132.1 hypothetical protein [Roseibacillus persicicus]
MKDYIFRLGGPENPFISGQKNLAAPQTSKKRANPVKKKTEKVFPPNPYSSRTRFDEFLQKITKSIQDNSMQLAYLGRLNPQKSLFPSHRAKPWTWLARKRLP